ncbi:MAG TPA: uL15 family ribosomal protein [Candidatus Paceibacterota bacterium]
MQLNNLKRKTKLKTSPRVGRGGKRGKTSGRGTKGQNARAGRKKRPEERDIIKKLPKIRGRGKNINTSIQVRAVAIPLVALEKLPAGVVTVRTLVANGIIKKTGERFPFVKILGAGNLSSALAIKGIEVSEGARKIILKAGGKVIK